MDTEVEDDVLEEDCAGFVGDLTTGLAQNEWASLNVAVAIAAGSSVDDDGRD